MPTFEEELEKTKKEEEERLKLAQFRAMMEEAAKTVQRGTPSQQVQTEPLSLSGDQIKEYQGRLTKNLDDREKLRGFLMSFLKREGIDPTAPTDPSRDYSINMTPGMLAKEIKQKDREGKSGIGNFFRNIDYALGDGSGRDKASAEAQQKTAIMALQDILRDNGTEIRNTMGDQAKLAKNWMELQQRGGKIQADNATKQAGVEQKALDSSYQNTMTGIRGNDMLSMNPFKQKLMESQVKVNENRALRPSVGMFSREMNEIMEIQRLRDAGENEKADLLDRELKKRKAAGLFNQLALKGGMDTERGQIIQGLSKDGNILTKEMRVGNKVINPWREALTKRLQGGDSPQGQASSTVTYAGAEPITQTLTNAARNATTPQKVAKIVDKAVGKATSDSQRQFIATQALTEGLTPKQIENDALRGKIGHRYTLEDLTPDDPSIVDTGIKKQGEKTMNIAKEMENVSNKINTATRLVVDGASTGMLKKVFGAGNNWLSTGNEFLEALPFGIGKNKSTASNLTHNVERIYPGITKSSDPQVQQFANQLEALMISARAATNLEESGKALNEVEIEQAKSRLPKITDTPEVALQKILTYSLTAQMSGYLASKGYGIKQIQNVQKYLGDYLTPRINQITQRVQNAPAQSANGKYAKPQDAVKDISFREIDPEDIIGEGLYEFAKKKGVNFKDIAKLAGVKMRRLVPDEGSSGVIDPMGQQIVEELRKIKESTGKKKR